MESAMFTKTLALVLLTTSWSWSAPPVPKFTAHTLDGKVQIGYGLQIGDVDGDGRKDILLADKTQFVWYQQPKVAPGKEPWVKHVLAENLTPKDNVCIAARDIDGDGKVEIAVGANWNPSDTNTSGSVHALLRPSDPTARWTAVALHHEPTVHRMHWIKRADGSGFLVVKPLHGKGNDLRKPGSGAGGKVWAYAVPPRPADPWRTTLVIDDMHVSHNFDPVQWDGDAAEEFVVGGLEGAKLIRQAGEGFTATPLFGRAAGDADHVGIGEIRVGNAVGTRFIATIEPFHGHMLAVYRLEGGKWTRRLLDDSLKDGHALACGDLLGLGTDQIVVGWRKPDAAGKVGIKLFIPSDGKGPEWTVATIDDNTMACEDLKLADLDGDGKLDIIAAGRDSHNLVVYWNVTGQ
jgi:hypothetical protein